MMIPFSIFIFWYQDTYRNATEEFQNLYFAIGAGVAGTILHFLKNIEKLKIKKPTKMTIDSLELLLLVFTPTTTSFTILKKQFPGDVYPILIVLGLVLSFWYVIILIRTRRTDNKIDGKPSFVLSSLLYWSFIGLIVFGAVLPIIFK